MAIGDPGTANGWIKTRFLKDDCVTAAKLADGAVGNDAIGALAVDTAELAADAVTGDKIEDDAVDSEHIATGAIDPVHFAAEAVETAAIADDAVTAAKLANEPTYNGGSVAQAILRVANNVADGEVVVIGSDQYEVETLGTDSTNIAGGVAAAQAGAFNNTTDPLTTEMNSTDYPVIGVGGTDALVVGRLILIDSEILRVTGIATDDVTFERGVCNTSTAVHTDGTAIFIDDGTALDGSTTIRVGNDATLTPAVFTDALVDEINNRGTEDVFAQGLNDNEVWILAADAPGSSTIVAGAVALATTETLAGVNNEWGDSTMTSGNVQASERRISWVKRVPTSTEVDLGDMRFAFPYTPYMVQIKVETTATGIPVAWNGGYTITAGEVVLNNDGVTDWAATDTVYVVAYE